MDTEIIDDQRSRAMSAIAAWLRRDQEGFDAVVGTDEEAAVLLPVVIGELATAIERLVGPDELSKQVSDWLDERAARLAG